MNSKIIKVLLVGLTLIMLFGTISASAITPYTTYTYSVNGTMQRSPHAYTPSLYVDSAMLLESLSPEGGASDNAKAKYNGIDPLTGTPYFTGLNAPEDIFVDELNHVYIVNTGNNQIVVTDENYNIRLVINKFINHYGVVDEFKNPKGIYVSEEEIFVADKEKKRIVIFDKLGNFVDIVPEPSSEVLPEGHVYHPIAVAVDKANRLYVVSEASPYGILSLNRDGTFNGFIGAQKVAANPLQFFVQLFQSEEEKKKGVSQQPTEYNNLCIDSEGFVYATTASIEDGLVIGAIKGKSKSGDYAPVKKLNPNGSDVMSRNGFWPPSGEVDMRRKEGGEKPSEVFDVAVGPNNTWSIIDNLRSRIFTYDSNGNLLFAFGDKGQQLGQIANLKAIDYKGTDMLLLDKSSNSITVYERTGYGDLLAAAIQNTEDRQYDKAVDFYISILQRNNNYDAAYVGIAESLYLKGEYIQAMKYYKYAYNIEGYSEAYQAFRKGWMEQYVWSIPLVLFVAIFAFKKLFSHANKVNKAGQITKEKRKFSEEVFYGFHVIFHPFDGFWDLKHEKRGSVRGAIFWLVLAAVTFVYQTFGRGYLQNPYGTTTSIITAAMSIVAPVILWVVANWCITTLFEGEGSFKDVFIATCYSLVPLPLLIIPSVLISNGMTLSELQMVGMIQSIAFAWFIMLVFFGMMVTHDYSLGKNFITSLVSIVGIAFIIFLIGLFTALIAKVVQFIYQIYFELSHR